MDEHWMRLVGDLTARVDGPLKGRLLLQPAMACMFAAMAGLKDARAGKAPYFWSLANDPAQRSDMLRAGWKDIGKVFLIALALDVVYQVVAQRFVYPGEAILVALVLAIVPYLVARGLVTRLAGT